MIKDNLTRSPLNCTINWHESIFMMEGIGEPGGNPIVRLRWTEIQPPYIDRDDHCVSLTSPISCHLIRWICLLNVNKEIIWLSYYVIAYYCYLGHMIYILQPDWLRLPPLIRGNFGCHFIWLLSCNLISFNMTPQCISDWSVFSSRDLYPAIWWAEFAY